MQMLSMLNAMLRYANKAQLKSRLGYITSIRTETFIGYLLYSRSRDGHIGKLMTIKPNIAVAFELII
jgi:hypothetical protein